MAAITALAIGDLHFRETNMPESVELVEKLVALAQARQPKFIVCLGDTLHTHAKLFIEPLCLANKTFKRLAEVAPVFVLIGNHDRINNSDFLTKRHPFTALKGHHNITVVDKPVLWTYKQGEEEQQHLFVPYVKHGRMLEAISTLQTPISEPGVADVPMETRHAVAVQILGEVTAVWAHQDIYGAKEGTNTVKKGDRWLPSYPYLISGHIHEYQRPYVNVLYTGTPRQINYSGEADYKTVSWLSWPVAVKAQSQNTEDKGTKVHRDYPEEERIDLGCRKRITRRITAEQARIFVPSPDETLLRLVIVATDAERASLMSDPHVKALEKQGIIVTYEKVTLETTPILLDNSQAQIPYIERVYRKVQTDERAIAWIRHICGMSASPLEAYGLR